MTDSVPNQSTYKIVGQLDQLLEAGDLSTKNGLRFAFTVLREALAIFTEIEERVKTFENAYLAMVKNVTEVATKFDDVSRKVHVMWIGYQIGVWIATIIGLSVIGLIWSLITGAASINFGSTP